MADKTKLQSQRWHNQNQFLEDRHGPNKSTTPEIILVALPSEEHGFDLLCWTINMAARPGDTVIAYCQHNDNTFYRKDSKLQVSDRFKPLQDLCDVKQVQLKSRFASAESGEKCLVDEALFTRATMLVVTTSGHHLLRHALRRGRFLATHVPAGCSVVVVKDYKVLFYKENQFKDLACRTRSLSRKDTTQVMQKQVPQFQCGALQDLQSSVTVREIDTDCQLNSMTYRNVWSDISGTSSPRRVFDGPETFSDSDDESAGSNRCEGLSRSSSRKVLISRASSHGEEDLYCIKQSQSCLGIWKGVIMRRLQTFPPASRQTIKTSFSFHCRAFGSSLKWCVSSLWGSREFKKDKQCTSYFVLKGAKPWRSFALEELLLATNYFSPGNLVGKGGHAEVYKGLLCDGQQVAVKKLIRGDTDEQKVVDFLTELGMICHISHPNITPLIGFCIEKGLHLIFGYLRRGSLASWLHGGRLPVLEWRVRYNIAVGTARGLNYLHTGCQRRIIHRDIKASNILLGPDFKPQISDFGLAKWLPNQCSHHVLTPIEGTFGYLAPEYFMHGIVDEKTDVFAFGVLLLELITGRKPIEGPQSSLIIWARPLLEGLKMDELVDPRLNGSFDPQEMQCTMMAAALCIQHSPLCRPCMSQVLELLTDELSSDRADSLSMLSSQSFYLQDPTFDGDYSCINYRDDLQRHREIALQF